MKKSNIILSLILFLCLSQSLVNSQTIQPVERSVGNLRISVDPRIELLATVQLLSNYPLPRKISYNKDIIKHFTHLSSHEAVKQTDSFWQNSGFVFDAPIGFMLHLSQFPELKTIITFSDDLLKRSGGGNNLEQYRESIKQFAEISNFEIFWNSKIPYYNKILDRTIAKIDGIDVVKVLEDYFNETQESYNIIIAPAFQGGYGTEIPGSNGKFNIYACLSVISKRFNNKNDLRSYIWHEFGHSFVNPLTDKYAARVMAIDKLFAPIKEEMSKLKYGEWEICVNEHIIRAVEVRLADLYAGSRKSNRLLKKQLGERFIYIEPLVEKLKDFEKRRDVNNISFSEFYPELLDMLDSLLAKEY